MALSLFDDNVPTAVKANMAQVMLEADKGEEEEEEENKLKRYILHQNDFSSFTNIEFSSFVTPGTKLSSRDFLSAPISSTKTLQHGRMFLVTKVELKNLRRQLL